MTNLPKLATKEVELCSTFTIGELITSVSELDYEDIVSVVVAIDLNQANSEFTLDLIGALMRSLVIDMDIKDIKDEVKKILRYMKAEQKSGEKVANG